MKLKQIIFLTLLLGIIGCRSGNAQDDFYVLKIIKYKSILTATFVDGSETSIDGYDCEIYKKTEKIGNIILILYSENTGKNVPKIEIGKEYRVKLFNITTKVMQLDEPNIDIRKIKFLTN